MSRPILHKHHIIPKHAGGTDEPSNLIYLTIEEHAKAHKQLWEEYGRWQDYLAWKGLSGNIGKDEINYIKWSRGFKSKTHSDDVKKIISETHKGKPKSLEHRKKISDAAKKRKRNPYFHSEQSKANMSAAQKKYRSRIQ